MINLGIFIYSTLNNINKLTKVFAFLSFASFLFVLSLTIALFVNNYYIISILLSSQFAIFSIVYIFWTLFVFYLFNLRDKKHGKYLKISLIIPGILFIGAFLSPIYSTVLHYTGNLTYSLLGLGYLTYLFVFVLTLLVISFCIMNIDEIHGNRKYSLYLMFILPALTIIPFFLTFGSRFYEFSITSITMTISIVVIFYGLFIKNLLDLQIFTQRDLIDNANIGMLYFDVNHNLVDYNEFCAKYGIDDSNIGMSIDKLVELNLLSPKVMEYHYDKTLESKQYKDEFGFWFDIKKNELYDGNEYLGNVYSFYEITRMKEAENKIIQATNNLKLNNIKIEQENQIKVESLQKVHHRIKNNLQTLISFIHLDKRFLENDKFILDNAINRIYAISLIHQNTYHELTPNLFSELYQLSFDKQNIDNDELSKINLNDFIRSLGEFIRDNNESFDFIVNYDIDERLGLDIDLISPLSLIFIELTYISINYGFNKYEGNEIDINIKEIDRDNICLTYGANINNKFHDSDNINFIIIDSLVNQIRGNLEVMDDGYFKLIFPLGD